MQYLTSACRLNKLIRKRSVLTTELSIHTSDEGDPFVLIEDPETGATLAHIAEIDDDQGARYIVDLMVIGLHEYREFANTKDLNRYIDECRCRLAGTHHGWVYAWIRMSIMTWVRAATEFKLLA